MTDDFTQAEIVRSLQRIEDGMARMRDDFQATLAEMVRRDAWEQKNAALDRELKEVKEKHEKDIDGIKEDLKRPSSVPSYIALGISVLTGAILLVQSLT